MTVGQYHYQPEPAAAPLTLSQYQYQPEPAAAWQTATQYHQPYAIVPHQPGDASPAPDYGSSFHERMRAIQAAQAQAMPSRARRCRTLEETRSALLGGAPMELQLVTFPDSAAHVVHLLLCKDAEGHERILQSVLAGVTRRVHVFIENKEGYEVLVALLRACAGRHAEVDAIVRAAVAPAGPGRNSLLRSPRHDYW
jgi:pumilio RNA-binding family